MRGKRPRPVQLRSTYSPGQYLVAMLLCIATAVTTLVAAAYPAVALAGVLVGGVAVAVRGLVRMARASQRREPDSSTRRQRKTNSGRVCVPGTGICFKL